MGRRPLGKERDHKKEYRARKILRQHDAVVNSLNSEFAERYSEELCGPLVLPVGGYGIGTLYREYCEGKAASHPGYAGWSLAHLTAFFRQLLWSGDNRNKGMRYLTPEWRKEASLRATRRKHLVVLLSIRKQMGLPWTGKTPVLNYVHRSGQHVSWILYP